MADDQCINVEGTDLNEYALWEKRRKMVTDKHFVFFPQKFQALSRDVVNF